MQLSKNSQESMKKVIPFGIYFAFRIYHFLMPFDNFELENHCCSKIPFNRKKKLTFQQEGSQTESTFFHRVPVSVDNRCTLLCV